MFLLNLNPNVFQPDLFEIMMVVFGYHFGLGSHAQKIPHGNNTSRREMTIFIRKEIVWIHEKVRILELRNRVTKSSNEIELRKMTSHFE